MVQPWQKALRLPPSKRRTNVVSCRMPHNPSRPSPLNAAASLRTRKELGTDPFTCKTRDQLELPQARCVGAPFPPRPIVELTTLLLHHCSSSPELPFFAALCVCRAFFFVVLLSCRPASFLAKSLSGRFLPLSASSTSTQVGCSKPRSFTYPKLPRKLYLTSIGTCALVAHAKQLSFAPLQTIGATHLSCPP